MRQHTTALTITALLLTATACSSDASTDTDDTKPTPTELTAEERASIADAGLPPKPDPATRTAYLGDLDAIDPDIVHGKGDKAVSRGRSQCSSIKRYADDQDKLIEHTNYRFTSPDHPNGHGTAKAEKILDVVHKHLCPDF